MHVVITITITTAVQMRRRFFRHMPEKHVSLPVDKDFRRLFQTFYFTNIKNI